MNGFDDFICPFSVDFIWFENARRVENDGLQKPAEVSFVWDVLCNCHRFFIAHAAFFPYRFCENGLFPSWEVFKVFVCCEKAVGAVFIR